MADAVDHSKKPYINVKEDQVQLALESRFGKGVKYVSHKFKDFTSKGDNYACIVTSIIVDYTIEDRQNTTTFVIKLNPNRDAKFLTEDFYKKEPDVYTIIVPALNKALDGIGQSPLKTAECFYVDNTPEHEVMYMEDLREKEFKLADRKKGLDIPHLNLVLEELGRFHAASVILKGDMSKEELLEKYPCLFECFLTTEAFENPAMKYMFDMIIQHSYELIKIYKGYEKIAEKIKALNFITDCFPLMESSPPFQVICHGDCWTNNFVFKYNEDGVPTDVRLLDLQVARIGSPTLDLNYMLYASVNGDTRKNNFSELINTYHNSFSSIVKKADLETFSKEELMVDFKEKMIFGLMMALMLIPAMVIEQNDVPDMETLNEENMESMMEDYLDKSIKNPLLRPRLLDMIDDMVAANVL